MSKYYVDLEARRTACTAVVTLDGAAAKISGIYNEEATVWPLARPADGVNFRWAIVLRVIAEQNGAFLSQ